MDTTILTKDERTALRSMARYWNEVDERDDSTPLHQEVSMVCDHLSTRILWIIEAYLDAVDEQSATNEWEDGSSKWVKPIYILQEAQNDGTKNNSR